MFEKEKPDYVARVWAAGDYCGEIKLKGHTFDSQQLQIPLSFIYNNRSTEAPVSAGQQGKFPRKFFYFSFFLLRYKGFGSC